MNLKVPTGLLLLASVVWSSQSVGQSRAPSRVNRALPPEWPQAVRAVFLPDAQEKLVGPRPDYGAASSRVAAPAGERPASGAPVADAQPAGEGGFAWSRLISRETIEDEVKALQAQISQDVTTPAKFKGGGFKAGRTHFSELAFLFAIIAQYDGDVRWKENAAGVRDLLARAGYNCKVGTDASYNEAKLRRDDLEQMVRGGRIDASAGDPDAKWDKITDRSPLMQRLEIAQQQRIEPWTANSGEFSKQAEELLREAELVAAISEAIQQEGFEYADDESYVEYAQQMRDAALEIVGAVKGKNYDAARAASGNISKACTACHEGFRA